MRESSKVLALLDRAKAGDKRSREDIVVYVMDKYARKIAALYSPDPADSYDDLIQVFAEGVIDWIPNIRVRDEEEKDEKGRVKKDWKGDPIIARAGDPIYHLAWRGTKRVHNYIRSKLGITVERSADATFDLDDEPIRERMADQQVDIEGVVVSQVGAQQQVDLILEERFAPTVERAIEAILTGQADPTESGFNKHLAEVLEVSPQRMSQVMASMRQGVADAGIEA